MILELEPEMILESEPHMEGRASEVKWPEGQWMRSSAKELNTAESPESQGIVWQPLDFLGLSFLFCTSKWSIGHNHIEISSDLLFIPLPEVVSLVWKYYRAQSLHHAEESCVANDGLSVNGLIRGGDHPSSHQVSWCGITLYGCALWHPRLLEVWLL